MIRFTRIAAPLAAAGLLAAAPTAVGGTVSVQLDPPLTPQTGANGWYRTPVTATYTCTPALTETVVACPEEEVLGDGAGVPSPVTRTATFQPVVGEPTTASVTLQSAPGVPLRIDTRPPPAPVVSSPVPGLEIRPGALVPADYACGFAGDASGPDPAEPCTGTVPAGEPIPSGTSDQGTWGPRTFTATARDAAGNTAVTAVAYRVEPARVAQLPAPPPPAGSVRPPAVVTPAPPAARPRPITRNARVLRPRAGVRALPWVLLRWPRVGGATVYNLQVFRITRSRYVKVYSAFPRGNRLRMPRGRLRPGNRYVWRVWPYLGRKRAYSRVPVGISWTTVVRARRR